MNATRTMFLVWLVLSTAAYGGSFFLPGVAPAEVAGLGAVIAGGATLSWFVMGFAAYVWARRRFGGDEDGRARGSAALFGRTNESGAGSPGLLDVAIGTAAWGDLVLTVGTLINVGLWVLERSVEGAGLTFLVGHAAVLLVSASTMTDLFLKRTPSVGVPRPVAAWLWFGGLNGTMLIVLVALAGPVGYVSLVIGGGG